MPPLKFEARLVARGPKQAWVFLEIPFNVEETFGRKARVAVCGTLNGFPYRNSLLPEGDGTHSMPVNKELMAGAKASAGETVKVVMEADLAPRPVEVPEDFGKALTKAARDAFEKLSYSKKREFVDWITQAKRPETRAQRIAKSIQLLKEGKPLRS